METIPLTDAQLRTLLNRIGITFPNINKPALRSLDKALHHLRKQGSGWIVEMTEEEIAAAIDVFEDYQREHPSVVAANCLRFLVNDSRTARKIYDERQPLADVPRETSGDES